MIDKPIIIGCDEVGTGCIAGPLVVVGVKAPKDWTLAGLNDSKKLSAKKREAMLLPLMELVKKGVISYHLAERNNSYIDEVGVAKALKEAYVECFRALYRDDCLIIADGNLKFDELTADGYTVNSVIKADSKYPAVMAASIIAKTWRDDKMHNFHHQYPNYDWINNVGYGSVAHLKAIKAYGPCPLHRMSYSPMKNMIVQSLPGEDPRQTSFKDF